MYCDSNEVFYFILYRMLYPIHNMVSFSADQLLPNLITITGFIATSLNINGQVNLTKDFDRIYN